MRTLLALALLAVAVTGRGAEPAGRIGAAAAVQGRATATFPGAGPRKLSSGSPLYAGDVIATEKGARLQVLLLDQTTFALGPASSMRLDRFKYDRAGNDGEVQASVLSGTFRFFTGLIAKKIPERMSVRTPRAVAAVRGTIVAGSVGPAGDTIVLLGPGEANNAGERVGMVLVSNPSGEVLLSQPGYATRVSETGAPLPPFELPPAELEAMSAGARPAAEPEEQTASEGEPAGEGETASAEGEGGAEPSGEGEAPVEGESVAEESGQESAEAAPIAFETDESAAMCEGLVQSTLDASRANLIAEGFSSWDEVRFHEAGTGFFEATGQWDLYLCGGSACADLNPGTMTLALDIDFGARTYGSALSYVSFSDNEGASSVSRNIPISAASFAELSGDAFIPLSASGTTGIVQLLNVDGQPAAAATVFAAYDDGAGDAGYGEVTAPRQEGQLTGGL